MVIICPNSHEKFIKSEIRSSWSRFEHWSKSLIWPLGSNIWSLFATIHMKSSPKIETKIEHWSKSLIWPLGSNIWSLFATIHMTKIEIRSSWSQFEHCS